MAKVLELLAAKVPFEEGSGVDTGRSVTLEIDLIGAIWMVLATEEVVEADFIKCGGRGVGEM